MKRIWEPNMILSQPQLAELAAQANKFGLGRDEVAAIERQVIGDTKEVIWERQCRRNAVNEYRAVVRRAWEPNRTLSPADEAKLATQATRLGLSQGEAIAIEREIMADTKEGIDERQRHQWALSEYRAIVRRVWEPNRMLTKAQVSELATQANRLGLNKDRAAAIERQVIGDTKEVIWEHQRYLNALTEYRTIVRRVWEPNRMLTKAQVAELVVHMVRLGLSWEEGAIIEREIMGKEIIERGLLTNVRSWGKKL
jgi:chorismate mutase